ncbi:MAG TPA: hypothetical protein VHP32_09135 [Ignavibacteria bacterium]|nr:hypothetical protein [Ignavibacteria bacterium]
MKIQDNYQKGTAEILERRVKTLLSFLRRQESIYVSLTLKQVQGDIRGFPPAWE